MGKISTAEIEYIRQGISENIRGDGRADLQFRRCVVQQDTIQLSNGSASCSLGETQVIVAVRADIGVPFQETPDQGDITCTVDISPCALQGPYTDAMGAALAKSLHDSLRWQSNGPGSALDLRKLSIFSGKRCWVLSVEGLVISADGNLLGALSIATKAALVSLRIPHLNVEMSEDGEEPEIDLDDDPEKAMAMDTSRVPLLISISSAHDSDAIDLTGDEETACKGSAMHVAVTSKGNICCIAKTESNFLPPEKLLAKVRLAQGLAAQFHSNVDAQLHS